LQRNIQQHFVTAAYLTGFTPNGMRNANLCVYERNEGRTFPARPDKVAKRRNYYSIPLGNGAYNDSVDDMITALENQATPVLRKLVEHDYAISSFERALFAHLIAFQELRTPWTRSMLDQIALRTTELTMAGAARVPGYLEHILEIAGEEKVSAKQLRDAMRNRRIVLQAEPHASLPLLVQTAPTIGNIYVQMQWAILRTDKPLFVTSDAPVVRRDPGYKGGMWGGGLSSPTVEIWFPLSRNSVLLMRPDTSRIDHNFELIQAGKISEAYKVRENLPPIVEIPIGDDHAKTINEQTIMNADRFVFSPFESNEIPNMFKGPCQNMQVRFSGGPSLSDV